MEHLDKLKIKPFWPKSKEETLVELLEQLDTVSVKKGVSRRITIWSYAAAIIIPVFLTGYFYTVTEKTARGEHSTVTLPCNSKVTLNAASKITYKPLIWFISRKVILEGEGCFEVKSGSRFVVKSGFNRVNVMGTAFNIYARQGIFSVTCLSGAVKVHSINESVVLNANMQATIHEPALIINRNITSSIVTGWMEGKFAFDKIPLKEVIAEVERQYNIKVIPVSYPNHLYTGNFSKTDNPAELLEVIGKPFGIKFSIE